MSADPLAWLIPYRLMPYSVSVPFRCAVCGEMDRWRARLVGEHVDRYECACGQSYLWPDDISAAYVWRPEQARLMDDAARVLDDALTHLATTFRAIATPAARHAAHDLDEWRLETTSHDR